MNSDDEKSINGGVSSKIDSNANLPAQPGLK